MRFVRESVYKFIKDPGDVRIGEVIKRGWVGGDVGILGVPWDGAVGPGYTHHRTYSVTSQSLTLVMLMWLLVIMMRLGIGLRRRSVKLWGLLGN